jgi:hypothetical protein
MKTEAEAKEACCPLALRIAPAQVNSSRDLCVGSRCMAWRWENSYSAKVLGSPPNHYGYCGMAGEVK